MASGDTLATCGVLWSLWQPSGCFNISTFHYAASQHLD
jgi:hypothetical protein